MSHFSMNDVEGYIRASKDVIDLLRTMTAMLPKGQQHVDAEKRLADAEKALRASEVQLAHSLGYNLCQCTFPPQIMLSKGYHAVHGDKEIFVCAQCNKQDPPPSYFAGLDRIKAHNDSLASGPTAWMGR